MGKVGEDICGVLLFAVVVILVFSSVLCIHRDGRVLARKEMQKELVARGVAEYDQKTGEWKYKDEFSLPEEVKP
jgi:hypothetical protein